jgi:hypothetical protein
MRGLNKQKEKLLNYYNVFKTGNLNVVSKIKIKVIQGVIQYEQPTNWTKKTQ